MTYNLLAFIYRVLTLIRDRGKNHSTKPLSVAQISLQSLTRYTELDPEYFDRFINISSFSGPDFQPSATHGKLLRSKSLIIYFY